MWRLYKGHYIHSGPLPPAVIKALPGAERVAHASGEVVACKAQWEAWRAIRKIGMPCPSPMRARGYPFEGHYAPMAHQVDTAESCLLHDKSFVLNDPGTGKTLSAIWAAQAAFKWGRIKRLLIVAPISVARGVWVEELFLHTNWPVADLTGKTRAVRRQLAQDPRYKVLIINPDSLHTVTDCVDDVDGLVVDEFTAFKSPTARRTKALRSIVDGVASWVVMMSGTPAPQGPVDAYMPIKLINPRAERLTKRTWQDMTMVQMSEFVWQPREEAKALLTEWLQPGIRVSREECLDLPPIHTFERRYELTPAQVRAVKAMRDDALAEIDGQAITAANAAVAASKALQILSGAVRSVDPVTEKEQSIEVDASTWVEAVREIVEERHDPVLIFVPFRRAAARLSAALDLPCINGDTPRDQRQSIYNQINAKSVRGVVAIAQTMSHGLTLTGATCVVWALPPISAEQYQQANARVYRKGQSKPVDIIHLVGHSFVQALFTRTDERVRLQQTVLDALARIR